MFFSQSSKHSLAMPACPRAASSCGLRVSRLATLLAGVAISVSDLPAQGSISGRIEDAVRSELLVPGLEVQLLGTPFRAHTDSTGRFRFNDLPYASYRVAHASAWLDSLGLPPLLASVTLSAASPIAELVLRTPSRELYHQTLCGQALEPDVTALIGELRLMHGGDAGDATVLATWTDLIAEARGVVRRTMRAEATADAGGAYRLCGVPLGTNVSIMAVQPDSTEQRWETEPVVLRLAAGAQRLDMVLGPRAPLVTIAGIVRSSAGAPVSAEIFESANDAALARTDSLGAFQIVVAPRTTQLTARAPGFAPTAQVVDPVFGPTEEVVLILDPIGADLAPIRIVESPTTRLRREFDERRQLHHQGAFLDDSTLARYPVKSTRVLQVHVPRSQVDRRGKFYLSFGSSPCEPRLFVDGTDMRVPDGVELQYWLERAKRIEVYRDTFSPPRFADPAGCGSIVLWTQ
jgi:hypothetical protein